MTGNYSGRTQASYKELQTAAKRGFQFGRTPNCVAMRLPCSRQIQNDCARILRLNNASLHDNSRSQMPMRGVGFGYLPRPIPQASFAWRKRRIVKIVPTVSPVKSVSSLIAYKNSFGSSVLFFFKS